MNTWAFSNATAVGDCFDCFVLASADASTAPDTDDAFVLADVEAAGLCEDCVAIATGDAFIDGLDTDARSFSYATATDPADPFMDSIAISHVNSSATNSDDTHPTSAMGYGNAFAWNSSEAYANANAEAIDTNGCFDSVTDCQFIFGNGAIVEVGAGTAGASAIANADADNFAAAEANANTQVDSMLVGGSQAIADADGLNSSAVSTADAQGVNGGAVTAGAETTSNGGGNAFASSTSLNLAAVSSVAESQAVSTNLGDSVAISNSTAMYGGTAASGTYSNNTVSSTDTGFGLAKANSCDAGTNCASGMAVGGASNGTGSALTAATSTSTGGIVTSDASVESGGAVVGNTAGQTTISYSAGPNGYDSKVTFEVGSTNVDANTSVSPTP
jgi:hypothetical protein